MSCAPERFAVYFVPPAETALAAFGKAWFGAPHATAQRRAMADRLGLAESVLAAITGAPRRYGFHATLKAPFRLRAACEPSTLARATRRLAAATPRLAGPPLRPALIGGFVALVPSVPCPALDRLADSCLTALDRFRAPLTSAEWRKRGPADLSAVERRHLRRWGYPYVRDRFRFHMTLTGRLDRRLAERIRAALSADCLPYDGTPLAVDGLTLVRQSEPGAMFESFGGFPLRTL